MSISSNRERNIFLTNQIYTELRDQILRMELKPGEKISERRIAEKMQCSRSPVSEAFNKLAFEGFLDIRSKASSTVSLIDVTKAEQACYIRECIEVAIARLCLKAPDFEEYFPEFDELISGQMTAYQAGDYHRFYDLDVLFHTKFACIVRREFSSSYFGNMNVHYVRLRRLTIQYDPDPLHTIRQHQDILNAYRRRDPLSLEQAVATHMQNTRLVFDQVYPLIQSSLVIWPDGTRHAFGRPADMNI